MERRADSLCLVYRDVVFNHGGLVLTLVQAKTHQWFGLFREPNNSSNTCSKPLLFCREREDLLANRCTSHVADSCYCVDVMYPLHFFGERLSYWSEILSPTRKSMDLSHRPDSQRELQGQHVPDCLRNFPQDFLSVKEILQLFISKSFWHKVWLVR